ncbi:MAG TPA: hypothetical protein VG407_12515 [Caulobacteraceae bacterium]|jgi:hypothetical protein|nr:hypothetical protein [Caulobacteraceae bacterium]
MELLYGIPAVLLLVAVLSVVVGAAVGVQALIHRRFDSSSFVAHNEVGGIIITVVAALYAVLLGFMTVVAWEHFQDARGIVVAESDATIDAWHVAVGLPSPVKERVRTDMIQYAHVMVDHEWALMKRGRSDETAAMISMDALDAAGAFIPTNAGEANAQSATIQQLNTLHDARQRRIASNAAGLSWFEWLVLVCGALCIVGFCWLFGGSKPKVQMIMTATVAVMIASTMVLLFEIQYPFRSSIGVGSEAWKAAISHIHEMQMGRLPNMRM